MVEAEHVAVIVPGINNEIDTFEGFRTSAQRLFDQAELLAPPDDAVFVGSPGVGVNDRDKLGEGFDVWAAKAPNDVVPGLPAHGEDPAAQGFGSNRFHTNGPGRSRITGHSSYFANGSESPRNLALIMTGQDDLVTRL